MTEERISPHHLVVYATLKVYPDLTGKSLDVPGIVYDGQVLLTMANYFVAKSISHSLAWMDKVREAVRLFLQYSLVNIPAAGFGVPGSKGSGGVKPREHFQHFAGALLTGTFDTATRIDPSGLCWNGAGPKKLNQVVHRLTEFFEWVVECRGDGGDDGSPFNPRHAGSAHERLMSAAAYEHRRSKAFLGHTWSPKLALGSLHVMNRVPELKVVSMEPPAFPDGAFGRLLLHGFFVQGHYNWRDMLITLLLHGAGFRESEPMHLYIEDVCEDPARPGSALVRIYHPTHGAAPAGWRGADGRRTVGKRRDYLAQRFGLQPRTEIVGKRRSGWKGGSHEDPKKLYKQAYWFKPEYGTLFWKIWKRYLHQVQRVERDHPYAFINLHRNAGAPYQVRRFQEAHEAAVRRAGLVPTGVESLKELGLTPHGHRHAYGRRLKGAGFHKKLIMLFMHHAAIESQNTYTQPSTDEVRAELDAASERLRDTAFEAHKFNLALGRDWLRK